MQADLLEGLPASDRRLVEDMAAAAGCGVPVMARQILREYLHLMRQVPEALPKNPMRRLARAASKDRGAVK